jgi:putative photosynthetic complex assembly protein
MSGHADIAFPREALLGAGLVIAVSLAAAIGVRSGLVPPSANPAALRAEARVEPVLVRELRFDDRADGAVVVTDLAGAAVAVIPARSEQGFVRGVLRGLARERRMAGIGSDSPFRLTLWSDRGLTLTDLATGRAIELNAFGPTNRAAFAAMLPAGDAR